MDKQREEHRKKQVKANKKTEMGFWEGSAEGGGPTAVGRGGENAFLSESKRGGDPLARGKKKKGLWATIWRRGRGEEPCDGLKDLNCGKESVMILGKKGNPKRKDGTCDHWWD